MRKALSHKEFRKLYLAGLTSELGTFITETALMIYLYNLSGNDKSILGLERTIFLFCMTMGSILGGPLGVRFNKKNLMTISEAVRIPMVIMLLFIQNIPAILMINGFVAFFTGIYNPSRQAIINEIVPEADIKSANSLFGSTMAILHLFGPVLGAALFTFFNSINQIVIIDALSFLAGVLFLVSMQYRSPHKKENNGHFLQDLKDGISYVKERKDFIALFITVIITGFCVGVLLPLILPFTKEVIGASDFHYGVIISLFGLGGIFGGFLSQKLNQKFSAGQVIVYSSIAEAVLMPIWLYSTNFYANAVVIFVWGIVVFVRFPSQLNYISEHVSNEFMTRVHALMEMAFVIPNVSGALLVGLVGNLVTTFDMLLYTSIFFVVGIGLHYLLGPMKKLLDPNTNH